MAKVHELYYAALQADKAFSEALTVEYGKEACNRRYDTKDFPPHIDALFKVKAAADDDYRNEVKGNR